MSDMKCPFCGQKLLQEYNRGRDTVIYRCDNCYFQGDGIIWQALIQAKQDLEIARQALENIKSDYELYSTQGCRMEPNETDMYNYARQALEQIEHKETQ